MSPEHPFPWPDGIAELASLEDDPDPVETRVRERPDPVQARVRRARVFSNWRGSEDPEAAEKAVEAYMPGNYRVIGHGSEPRRGPDPVQMLYVLIEGTDSHGWTMEDYIIPRLASGLYWAEEVTS